MFLSKSRMTTIEPQAQYFSITFVDDIIRTTLVDLDRPVCFQSQSHTSHEFRINNSKDTWGQVMAFRSSRCLTLYCTGVTTEYAKISMVILASRNAREP